MTVREWTLEIAPPAPFLSSNSRKDRRGDDDRRQWRAASFVAAQRTKLPTGLDRVRVDVVVAPPHNRYDRQNLRPTTKALVDGLGPPYIRKPTAKQPRGVSAPGYGLIPNDGAKHLDGEHLHVVEPVPPRGHVTIHIVDLTNVPPGRSWTPHMRIAPDGGLRIKVKRCCNGCGDPLGDPTDEEIAAAIAGASLPDVRHECPNCKGVGHAA